MQMQYVIELRNHSKLWITDTQARVVNQAWQDRAPVKVNGSLINTVDIVGIWDETTWYDNHPDDRLEAKAPLQQLPAVKQTENSELWLKVLKANNALISKNLLPRYTIENNKVVEKPYFWRGTLTKEPIIGTVVKKSVTDNEYRRKYANRNGYHLLGKDYDKNIVVFTVVGEVPIGCELANRAEKEQVYGIPEGISDGI